MNPISFLTEGEQQFLEQEKLITDAVIGVIAVAKKENAQIRDENISASVVDACKQAVAKTQTFKALMQGARRPYITHAVELLDILAEVNASVTGIEDVLAASRAEHDAETAEAGQTELREARTHATELIANFKRWLYTSDASYMFASDRTLEMPQPASPDVAKTDMLRCPRWLITHLVEARRNELRTETAWRAMGEELNETKKKLTLATGQDEIKAKDAIIKKLNASLQVMYRDVEEKTKELEDVRAKAIQLATQLKTIKQGGSVSSITLPPEGSGDDQQTIQQLRAEVARLRSQVQFVAPARARARAVLLPSTMTQYSASQQSQAQPGSGNANTPQLDDDLPPPPPEDDSIPFMEAKYWMSAENKRIALASMLTDPEMTFVDVLCRAIAGGNDADACASYLINLYSSQDTLMTVLEHLIYTEVSRCKSVNTLFRGEELSSRVLRSYVRQNGYEYIRHILGDLVEEVAANNYFFEIDPNRSNPSMDLKDNFTKLEDLTQRFLDAILDSYNHIPPEFLRLCKCIYTHSAVKFANEDFEQLVVSGFMFLRFICPAIAAPESFKLTPIETPEARRTLLLVGKILQNLANGVEFKEPFLQDMNSFLTKNAQRVKNFFQKLRTYPVEIDANAPYLVDISRSVFGKREKIKSTAKAENVADKTWACEMVTPIASRLSTIMSHILPSSPQPVSAIPANLAAGSRSSGGTSIPTATSSSSINASASSNTASPESAATIGARADLVKCFSNVLFDNTDVISRSIFVLPHVNADKTMVKRNVAEAFTTIAYHTRQIDTLARACIQNESSPSAYDFLHSSFTKNAFSAFALTYCGPWLASVLSALLEPIIAQNTFLETDPAKVVDPALKARFNRDEMIGTAQKVADSILVSIASALPSCPRPLWLFCNTLSLNTAQDVAQFMLVNFIVPFLESPHTTAPAQFPTKPKKEAARSLQIIADMIRNFANGSNILVDNIPMVQVTWSDNFVAQVANWSRSLPGYLSDTMFEIPPETVGQAVLTLTQFFQDNWSKLVQLLEGTQTTHHVIYSIHELMDSLTAPAPADKPKDPVSAVHAMGERRASSQNLDPKAAAKKAKEDEKRAKEEEEKRKKDEKKRKEEEERRKKDEEKKRKEEEKKAKH